MTRPTWEEFEKQLEEQAEMESSGGGASVCFAEVEFGYPVFVSGLDEDERWFPAPVGKKNKDAQREAEAQAKAKASEYEADPNSVRFSLRILFHANGALKIQNGQAQPAGWAGNMSEIVPYWTMKTDTPSAFKELHFPAMKENELYHGWKGWVKVGYARNPYHVSLGEEGMVDEDQNGEPRYPIVRYITKVYNSKEEAYADVEFSDDVPFSNQSGGGGTVPDGYSPEGWDNVKPAIKKQLADGDPPAKVAGDYGVSVPDITALM